MSNHVLQPVDRGRPSRAGRSISFASIVVVVAMVLTGCNGPVHSGALPSMSSPLQVPSSDAGQFVGGPIRSLSGPYLYDQEGRVVFLHGVNAVYKRPPYELYPAPGKPWNFTAADASLMARLGFNVVRLGMTWKGLEPGTAPANDPAICAPGAPGDPGQFNPAVVLSYLTKLKQTVDLLGRYHIFSLLDMHQDVYNEMFDGEGAPNWAVCTNSLPNTEPPGRWSSNYATAAADVAYAHFWNNDVVGNLQGEYDRVWAEVASFFRSDPWVVGYDPFNEPFSVSLVSGVDEQFDAQLECFYTGTALIGQPSHGAPPITCPFDDPAMGVLPQILAADPTHVVFYEPDIFGRRGRTNFVGPMNFPNLVFNVHIYCSYRSGKTGNPTDIAACASQETRSLTTRSEDRRDLGSTSQPGGPAWFVSEFGATSSSALLRSLTGDEDRFLVGWAYWSWKFYRDPTGSAAEALVTAKGTLRSTARVLSRAYPQAIAGRPRSMMSNPTTGAFKLQYVPERTVHAPTLIFVPVQIHYPSGYCTRVSGGSVISKPGASILQIQNARGARVVTVTVTAGTCGQ